MIFGSDNVTTGASSDIKMATNLSRSMVTEYGFSDKLGPLRYTDNEEEIFLGHSVAQRKNVSEQTAALIDEETRRLVEEGETTARRILTQHLDDLHKIAKALLEYETLSRDEVDAVLRGEKVHRPEPDDRPRPEGGVRSTLPSSGRPGKEPPGLEPEPQPGA